MTQYTGWVVDVTPEPLGSALLEQLTYAQIEAGVTELALGDSVDFEEAGGTLDIGGSQLLYVSADLDADTVTLAEPLPLDLAEPASSSIDPDTGATIEDPGGLEAGTTVAVWDTTNNAPATVLTAYVRLGGEGADDDPVPCLVAHALIPLLPTGVREGVGETVLIDDASGSWRVIDVQGKQAVLDGTVIDPTTLPPPGDSEPTEPPASSPAVEIHGTADALVLEVTEPYDGSTTLDFHIATTADFAPSPDTLAGSSRSAVFVITALPTVTAAAEGEDRLHPDTTYYVRTVAHNVVGAAAPSPVASGALDPSTVSEIVAARLVVGFVLAGSIQAGNITINPDTGITIPQSDGGVIHFPADGSPATITAYLNARGLRVENDLVINGVGELSGTLKMTGGAPPPKVTPTLTTGYPMLDGIGPYTIGEYQRPANDNGFVAWTSGGPRFGTIAQAQSTGGAQGLMIHNGDTGAFLRKIRMDKVTGGPITTGFWVMSVALAGHPSGTSAVYPGVPEGGPDTSSPYYAWLFVENRSVSPRTYHLVLVDLGPADDVTPPTYVRGIDVSALVANANISGSSSPKVVAYRNMNPSDGVTNEWHPVLIWEGEDASVSAAVFDGITASIPQIGATQQLLAPSTSVTRTLTGASFSGYEQLQLQLPSAGRPKMSQFDVAATHASSRLSGLTITRSSTSLDVPFPEGAAASSAAYAGGIAADGYGSDGERLYVLYPDAGRVYRLRVDSNQARWNFNATDYRFAAAYTWYDGNASGGTHESTPSPRAEIVMPPMTWPIVSAPAPPHAGITDPLRPDLANRIGIYASRASGATPPQVMLQTYLPLGIRAAVAGSLNPRALATVTPPPTVDGFAGTAEEPGNIQSGDADAFGPLIKMDETGAWRLGPLSGAASGSANGAGRVQAGVSTYRATPSGSAPGTILGQEATPTVWSSSMLRRFTYSGGAWTCQPGGAGTYLVWAKATWAADTGLDWGCGLQVWKNGAQMGGINDIALHSKTITNSTGPVLLAPIEIAVGDQMAMSIWQNSGAAKTPNGVQFYLTPLLS